MDLFWIALFLLCILPIFSWIWKRWSSAPLVLEEPILLTAHAPAPALLPTPKKNYGLISKCSDIACYHSDIGVVAPLEVYHEEYYILPYQKTEETVQRELALKLRELHPTLTREDILEQWVGSDVFYVMMTHTQEVMGSIAVDRKNFEPFLSYVYVDPKYRNQGYGERLLQHGEDYAREFKFKEVKLWCKETLIPYYTRYGWEKIGEKPITDSLGNEVWVMKKGLHLEKARGCL